ncbi:alpha/beta hydrolase [Mucilaginibacter sp.]|uniref:alpha/beta hydrolase n=1 Tax=Mucilaginibacter sp. TaxID=1882438 RepID=UPI000CBE7649|nr:alpha/beta fold hydrolase [Mucilaginibacter sp.]PLW89099.1 MAG: hypothetical protein C0154_13275 [Mucilaginibacter sp.]HEK21571.1 hypothetical protein [Bacteroidota bacterium]
MDFTESTFQLQKEAGITVTAFTVAEPKALIVFAAGRGGSPSRHLPLLRAIAARGYTVAAPHFDMIPSAMPTKEQLDARIRQLEVISDEYTTAGLPVIGVGHSIGATLLLTLAGAKAITFYKESVKPQLKRNFAGLVLLAPAVDFFLHEGASDAINTKVYLRTGAKDNVTPADRTMMFKAMLEEHGSVNFVLDEQAGHFSYMDQLPPNVKDPQPDRHLFLEELANDVAKFIVSLT